MGTGVCTVRTGHFAIEAGYNNTVTPGSGGGNTAAYGATLLRVGTGDPHLDFELTPPALEDSSLGAALVTGSSDLGIGAKYELGYTAKALWGINAEITVPSGTPAFSARLPQYIGNVNWGYALNSTFGVNGTLGLNWLGALGPSGAPQQYFAFIPTLEATAALPGPSQLFVEYAYFSSTGIGTGAKSLIDGGYVRDLGTHVQIDVEYGISPTLVPSQRQHYFGAGISFMN